MAVTSMLAGGVLKPICSDTVLRKSVDDSINKLGQLMEDWKNRLKLEGLSLVKSYVEGRIELLADLEVIRGGDTHKYRAIFHRPERTIDHRKYRTVSLRHSQILDGGELGDRDKHLVLVQDVEVVDGAKVVIPSLVRFESADYIDDIWGGTVYMSLLNHTFKVLPSANTEREIDLLDTLPVEPDKITGQQVECAPEVVNCIPNDGGNLSGELLRDADSQRTPSLTLTLYDNGIGIQCRELEDFPAKLRDVAFGPFNLQSRPLKERWHGEDATPQPAGTIILYSILLELRHDTT